MASFYDSNGKIIFAATHSDETLNELIDIFVNQQGLNYIEGIYEPDNYYIESSIAVKKEIAPSISHEFNYLTKQWELPQSNIDSIKHHYKIQINTITGNIITAKYPDYAQRNIIASGNQDLITYTWAWINSIRDLSNITNESINNSTNSDTIYDIYQSFLTTIEGI